MKKMKIAAMGLLLITALAACGKDTEKNYSEEDLSQMSDKEIEASVEQPVENLEEEDANSDSSDIQSTESTQEIIEPTQEIIDSEWYSGKIQIEDIVIQLPVSVSELSELGFEYKLSDDKSDDYLFDETQTIPLSFYLDGTEVFSATLTNDLEGFHTVSEILAETDLKINSVSDQSFYTDNVYYAGGLKIGDSLSLVEERLGTPYDLASSDSVITYNYGVNDPNYLQCCMIVSVNRDTQQIASITTNIDVLPTVLDCNTFTTLSIDELIDIDNSVHNYSVNLMPGSFYSLDQYDMGSINSSFILDGQVYSFRLAATVFSDVFDDGNMLFSETDADGVKRTLAFTDEYSGFYKVNVYNGTNNLYCLIYINNISMDDANACYSNEQIINAVTEIVKSIQFDYK